MELSLLWNVPIDKEKGETVDRLIKLLAKYKYFGGLTHWGDWRITGYVTYFYIYNPGQKSLGQFWNIHIFLSFLGSLLKQCILFAIFFQVSLPSSYPKLKLVKNSGYTCPTLFVGWGEGLDLWELQNAPETQKCPKTFVHDCRNMTVLTSGYFLLLQTELIKIKTWILNKLINFYNVDPNNKSPLNAEAARLWNCEGN